MKRLWLTIAALLLAAGPASAQFNTKGTESYRNALTGNYEFGVPRFTTAALPACSSNLGGVAWDTTASAFKVCDASTWAEVGGGIAVGDDNDWTGTQTFLDNKWTMKDGAATTATMAFLLDNITAGQQSVITVPDADFTLLGDSIANVLTQANTFGSAAAAANSFVTASNGITFEGATADAFELLLTVQDPRVASTFTLGASPDGNPWLGAGVGAVATSAETDDVCLGEGACAAITGTATDLFCGGDGACANLTTADGVVAIGASVGATLGTGGNLVIIGSGADVLAANQAESVIVGAAAISSGSNTVVIGHSAGVGAQGVSIGEDAGDAQVGNDTYNTLVGYQSGTAIVGVGTYNSCYGSNSCDLLTAGDRNLLLGSNADVGTNTDSDVTVIGESMVGKGSDTYLDGYGGRERCFTQGTGKALTESSPTAFVRISVATESYTGAWIRWRVLADDGTDFQSLSGESVIDVVNKADAEGCSIRTLPAFAAAVEQASSGTLALEADPACATAAASSVDVSLDAISSLTQSSLNVFYTICVDGPQTTISPQ